MQSVQLRNFSVTKDIVALRYMYHINEYFSGKAFLPSPVPTPIFQIGRDLSCRQTKALLSNM